MNNIKYINELELDLNSLLSYHSDLENYIERSKKYDNPYDTLYNPDRFTLTYQEEKHSFVSYFCQRLKNNSFFKNMPYTHHVHFSCDCGACFISAQNELQIIIKKIRTINNKYISFLKLLKIYV